MDDDQGVFVEETIVTTSEIIASAGDDEEAPIDSSDIIATVVSSDTGEPLVSLGGATNAIHLETIQSESGELIHIQTTDDSNAIQILPVVGGDIGVEEDGAETTTTTLHFDGTKLEEISGPDVLRPTFKLVAGVAPQQPIQQRFPEPPPKPDLKIPLALDLDVGDEDPIEDKTEDDYERGTGKEEVFPCEECMETFKGYDEYKEHQKCEHDKEINCEAEEHTWKPYYVIHTGLGKRHVDDYEEFECGKCSFIASKQEEVDEHFAQEHKKPSKPRVKCDECHKTFARKYELATHVKKAHLRIKDHKCPQCDYCSADKGAVKKHLRAVHWDERNYPCPYCEYKSKTNGGIENHVKAVHLKIKDYVCEYCEAAFAQSGQLKAHIQRRHLEEKNFQCSECDFRAINQSLVRRHIKIKHEKIKDFLCNACGYGSTSRKQLEMHIEKIHKNKKRRKLKPIFLQQGFRLKTTAIV